MATAQTGQEEVGEPCEFWGEYLRWPKNLTWPGVPDALSTETPAGAAVYGYRLYANKATRCIWDRGAAPTTMPLINKAAMVAIVDELFSNASRFLDQYALFRGDTSETWAVSFTRPSSEQGQQPSADPAIVRQVVGFRKLAPGWDGHGAVAIGLDTIQRAVELMMFISQTAAVADERPPFAAPCGDGSILLQWDFGPERSVEAFVESQNTSVVLENRGQLRDLDAVTDQQMVDLLRYELWSGD